jgi:hypothetical protein
MLPNNLCHLEGLGNLLAWTPKQPRIPRFGRARLKPRAGSHVRFARPFAAQAIPGCSLKL